MIHHFLQIASLVAPTVADKLLDRFPRLDRFALQTFRPEDCGLAAAAADGGPELGLPETRAVQAARSADGLLRSGVWECQAGTRTYQFTYDEWVYILEGEAHVTAAGERRTLRAGDVALFRANLLMRWEVPEYVRKVWVARYRVRPASRLTRRARRFVRKPADATPTL